jgi:formate hydrogenlyase transcriptional activator
MSSADRREITATSANWLQNWPRRYGLALVAVAAAALLRDGLHVAFGFTPAFTLFYPTIMLIVLLEGWGPAVFATLLSAGIADYFFVKPVNSFAIKNLRDAVGLVLFGTVGFAISSGGELLRRRTKRMREFEKAVENLEEMITVVDRDYRYVLVNRAFLNYRGMKESDLIGRQISEVLDPVAFETTIKGKLDECFRGQTVHSEMRYKFPLRGERDLFVSYYPMRGPGGVDRITSVLQDITERKEAERSLKLFRTLIDQSNDAVEVVDPETLRFLDVNEKACKDLGYTREELLSITVFDTDPGADERGRVRVLDELRDSGSVVLETVHRRKDGSTFPVETSLRRVELGRSYVVAVTRDISERKRTENALRDSEDRYRDLVEHSQDLVCTHDLEGRLLSVNPASARMVGYEVAELLKMPMRELIAPECREQFEGYLERIRTTGADQGLLCVVTRNGERRIWEYNNTLRTEGVESPIVRGMARDVTERKRWETALRRSEQRYRLLFEQNVAGVSISNMDGKMIECNDAGARILGYKEAEEIRGRLATDFYFDVAERQPLLSELRREGTVCSRELRLRRKDGTPVWVLFNTAELPGEDESTPLVQATSFDITERKKAEEALRRREEDYRSFVAQSSEGIFRIELDTPVAVGLSEDELAQHILHHSYMAECNDAMGRMYGFATGEELLGKRLTEMLVADDPHNLELTRQYIRSGFNVLERELHEVDIQGNPKVFRNSLIGIVEDKKLVRTWGIQRDVTEQVKLEDARSRAEKALQVSENHFRLLVEQASDGIFISDARGKYLDVNSAGAEMLGYTRNEILQLSLSDILAAEEHGRLAAQVTSLTGGAIARSEWTFRRKDGSFFPGEISGKQLPDGRLQGILRDISERRRSEEAMRRNEERFRVALKDSPITVFNQDRDLRYTWIYNPQSYWQQDVIGKTDGEIIGAKKAASLVELKRRVLKTGSALRQEVMIPHNGKSYAFDISVEPLFDASGNVIGITGASMDIAQLWEMMDRLQDARDKLAQEKSYLEGEIQTELGFEEIIGQSPALLEVLKNVRIVAPTDSTVLLLGETGTGKELVARSVHSLSARRDKTFVKLNCAAVPAGLLESELFGHEKGAFTGAVSQKVGRIELADKGTLFLDEIGELPIELQPKLLRVLQDREFERLGGIHTLHVDVRIISATNRDLQQDIAAKKFREDLFYRLNVFPIDLPPLRQRRSDIPILVQHFVSKHAARMSKHIDVVPDETITVFQNWNWPGNIRELENMIERMVILSKGRTLAAPPVELDAPQEVTDDNLTEMEREHIVRILRETNGVLSGTDGAASRLGVKRTTLQSMLKRFGIELQDFRGGSGTFGA